MRRERRVDGLGREEKDKKEKRINRSMMDLQRGKKGGCKVGQRRKGCYENGDMNGKGEREGKWEVAGRGEKGEKMESIGPIGRQ